MKMKRSYYVFCIAAGILVGFLFSISVGARVASKYTVVKEGQPKTVGKYKVSYKYNDGKGLVYCTYKGKMRKILSNTAGFAVITNGTSIYYAKAYGDFQDGGGITIYRTNMLGTKTSKVGNMPYGEGLSAMYGDHIYCLCCAKDDETVSRTRAFNLKTKKVKNITDNTYITDTYDEYLITTASTGDVCALPIVTYNMKTGKKVTVTSSQWAYHVSDGMVYYLEGKYNYSSKKGEGKILSFNLRTGKKKILLEQVKLDFINHPVNNITSTYLEYEVTNKDYTQRKTYRFTYKKGEIKLISTKKI